MVKTGYQTFYSFFTAVPEEYTRLLTQKQHYYISKFLIKSPAQIILLYVLQKI
jgi:hypothetical protein